LAAVSLLAELLIVALIESLFAPSAGRSGVRRQRSVGTDEGRASNDSHDRKGQADRLCSLEPLHSINSQ